MADLLDLLSLAEGYQAVNVNSGDASAEFTAELTRGITAVSRIVDDKCGPVVVRTITDEVHDGARGPLLPRKWPVFSVTAVKEYAGTTLTTLTAETVASQTSNQFYFNAAENSVYRRSGGYDYTFNAGRGNVLITYVAGRYADTAAVDAKYKVAAASILRRLVKREAGSWAQNSALTFGEDNTLGFYTVVDTVLKEQLSRELLPPSVA